MDIEKLKETLSANGVDEKTIAKVIEDLAEEDEEEPKDETLDEGKTEEELPPSENDEPKEDDATPSDDEDGAEKEEGDAPQDEDVPPVPVEDVPPAESQEDVVVEEPLPQEQPVEEMPPVEEVAPQPVVPQVDPDLLSKLEEQASTIEGLLARVDSLESALKQAGVLDASDGEEVGIDNPRVPDTSSNGAIDDFDEALAYLNGRKRY